MKWNWIATIGFTVLMAPGESPALCPVLQGAGATDVAGIEASSAEAAPAHALGDRKGPGDIAYQTVVRRLREGQNVRVTTDTVRFKLRWAGASLDGISGAFPDNGSVSPAASSDTASVEWSEIRRIDVRGRATGTGWPIGLVVGALGGVAVGAGLSQMTLWGDEKPSRSKVESVALYFGAAGAVGGCVVGAIIGTAFPKWHAIYKQKENKR